jgi:hypothetical protein
MARPKPEDYNSFYQGYIDLVEGEDVVSVLETSYDKLQEWLQGVQHFDLQYAYAPSKWTVSQVLQHMIDTERVFAYRAMCIGRGETQPLPGFDENDYANAAPAAGRKWKGLAEELADPAQSKYHPFPQPRQRRSSLYNRGTASDSPVTVNALGFMIVGHVLHHLHVMNTRYL